MEKPHYDGAHTVKPILRVTSSETRSVCVKQAKAKFEHSSLIGQCRSLRWSRDTFFYKITTLLKLQKIFEENDCIS